MSQERNEIDYSKYIEAKYSGEPDIVSHGLGELKALLRARNFSGQWPGKVTREAFIESIESKEEGIRNYVAHGLLSDDVLKDFGIPSGPTDLGERPFFLDNN